MNKLILPFLLFSLFFSVYVYADSFCFPGTVLIKLKNGDDIEAESCTQEDRITSYSLSGNNKVYQINNTEIESIYKCEATEITVDTIPDQKVSVKLVQTRTKPGLKSAGFEQVIIPPATPKAWALAVTALLTERNHGQHDILAGEAATRENIIKEKRLLSDWWGVNNRDDLLNTLRRLENGGHRERFEKMGNYVSLLDEWQFAYLLRKAEDNEEAVHQLNIAKKYYRKFGINSILGWDYARYITLCRWGYLVGYLSEQEAWDRILPMAAIIQQDFKSWEDLGENYIVGREFWSYKQTIEEDRFFWNIYWKLLTDPASPWKLNKWNMDLHGK